MTVEHRLTFELFRVPGLEANALNSVTEKLLISKRSHEYVRRIMGQGFVLNEILTKADINISEIQIAVSVNCSGVDSEEFKLRLNVEKDSDQPFKTPEEYIWENVSKISKRDERKNFLRSLFLHGYWFESLPNRDSTVINQLFSSFDERSDRSVIESTTSLIKNSAKSNLGGLMPL